MWLRGLCRTRLPLFQTYNHGLGAGKGGSPRQKGQWLVSFCVDGQDSYLHKVISGQLSVWWTQRALQGCPEGG